MHEQKNIGQSAGYSIQVYSPLEGSIIYVISYELKWILNYTIQQLLKVLCTGNANELNSDLFLWPIILVSVHLIVVPYNKAWAFISFTQINVTQIEHIIYRYNIIQ